MSLQRLNMLEYLRERKSKTAGWQQLFLSRSTVQMLSIAMNLYGDFWQLNREKNTVLKPGEKNTVFVCWWKDRFETWRLHWMLFERWYYVHSKDGIDTGEVETNINDMGQEVSVAILKPFHEYFSRDTVDRCQELARLTIQDKQTEHEAIQQQDTCVGNKRKRADSD
jgi:hypothetical protein